MIDELRSVLEQRPCGLLTDIDGVLSPIAPTPDAAYVTPAARRHLQRLAERLNLVAAISGRAAADAARLVGLPQLIYIGNHGMEVWRNGVGQPLPLAQPFAAAIADVLREAEAQIKIPGVLWENKGVTASVHYRQTADPHAVQAELGVVLGALTAANGLRLTSGRMIWEIRPPLQIDKGVAVRSLVAEYGLRGAFFLGDDRTDADAFVVLRELRAAGTCATLAIGVVGPDTPSIVRETADVLVDGVSGVEQLLGQMVALLEAN
jgi:trehalose 6-phosphate phosphatase